MGVEWAALRDDPAIIRLGQLSDRVCELADAARLDRSAHPVIADPGWVARLRSRVIKMRPTDSPTTDRVKITQIKLAVVSITRLPRAYFVKRYQADGGQASTGWSVRLRITSEAKSLAVS